MRNRGALPSCAGTTGRPGRNCRARAPAESRERLQVHSWRPLERFLLFGFIDHDPAAGAADFDGYMGQGTEPFADGCVFFRRHEQQQETAAARAQEFAAHGAGVQRRLVYFIDGRRRHLVGHFLLQAPGFVQQFANFRNVAVAVLEDLRAFVDHRAKRPQLRQNYYQAPIVTDGLVFAVDAGNLVSYENNSTTAYNLAGSETGTLTNGVGFDSGNADSWTFDGTNDYIDITGLDSSYQVSAGSIEAWIKPSSDGSDQMVCGLGGAHTLGATRIIRINGNQWGFVGYGSANQDWGNIAPVAFNTWAHIVIGWNGTALTFWLNGVEYNTTRTGIVTPNSSIIRLGVSTWNTSDRAFEGDIALMRMYSKLITSDEVTQNFNAQRNRFGI